MDDCTIKHTDSFMEINTNIGILEENGELLSADDELKECFDWLYELLCIGIVLVE